MNGTAAPTFVYGGPLAHVAPNGTVGYRLAWQRQINALTWQVSVVVQPASGRKVEFHSDLSVDREWRVNGG